MQLSPPSIRHPLLEPDGTMNHTWQRYHSDLYNQIKEQDTTIKVHEATIALLNQTLTDYIAKHP